MQFRDDIIRGIRLAAIAFAVLLIGLIGYRVLHETPAPRLAPPRDIAPPIPSIKPKVPDPLAVPAPPRAKADVAPRKAALHRAPVKKESTSTLPVPVVHNADVDPAPPQFEEIPVRPVAVNVLTLTGGGSRTGRGFRGAQGCSSGEIRQSWKASVARCGALLTYREVDSDNRSGMCETIQ